MKVELQLGDNRYEMITTEDTDVEQLKVVCTELADTARHNQVRLYVDDVEVFFMMVR